MDSLHRSSCEVTSVPSDVLAGLSDTHQRMGRRIHGDLRRSLMTYPDMTHERAAERARRALETFAAEVRAGRIR